MFAYFMIVLLIIMSISFIIYEIRFHKKILSDIEKEKQISFFANTRIQLIRMLHMKEISKDSMFFKFMLQATSYSIRALYFYEDKQRALTEIKFLEKIIPYIKDDKMKEEFKNLNDEQKELFVKTLFNILYLYFDKNIEEQFILKYYLKQLSTTLRLMFSIVKLFNSKNIDDKLLYYNDIDSSYNIRHYAFA